MAALADVVPNAIAAHWDILLLDARYAAHSLSRTPDLALTAILVVALGVGANTAVFSIADFMFLRPLPFAEPDPLMKIWQGTPGYTNGAQAGSIVQMVLREGLALALVGIAVGVAVAYVAARGISAILVGVRPEDPVTLTVAATLCLATTVLGCLRPALRAARVDPLTAMRTE